MNLRTKPKLLALALLVVAAVSVACWHFSGAASGLAYRLTPGQRLTFALEFVTASRSNFMGLLETNASAQNSTTTAHTSIEGELVATVLEAGPDGALIALQLRKAEILFAVNGELAPVQAETIQAELQRPLFAKVDARGRILSVRFGKEVQPLSQAFAQSLLGAAQVVLPADPHAQSWQCQEEDPNGIALVSYALVPESASSVLRLEKRRQSYQSPPRKVSLQNLEAERTTVPSGKLTLEFDAAQGVLQSLQGSELTTILVADRVVAQTETTLRLSLVRRDSIPAAEQQTLRAGLDLAGAARRLSEEGDTTPRETAMQRAELGDETLDSLLQQLRKLETSKDPSFDDTPLYLKLKAVVYLKPEACTRLGEELAAAKAEGPTMALLTGALSSVGHAEAQAALQTAIRARAEEWSAVTMLVPALGLVETPTATSEQTLRELARKTADEQIRTTAELALGIMAHSLWESQPQRAHGILQETLTKLAAADSSAERRQQLLVLGNIGAAETFDVIARHIKDESAPVRAAAAAALRWIESDAAERLLLSALTSDADEQVRLEAAQALGFRAMSAAAFRTQQSVLGSDTSASVRLALLRNVAKAHRAIAGAAEVLNRVAQQDAVQEVREEASRLLEEQR